MHATIGWPGVDISTLPTRIEEIPKHVLRAYGIVVDGDDFQSHEFTACASVSQDSSDDEDKLVIDEDRPPVIHIQVSPDDSSTKTNAQGEERNVTPDDADISCKSISKQCNKKANIEKSLTGNDKSNSDKNQSFEKPQSLQCKCCGCAIFSLGGDNVCSSEKSRVLDSNKNSGSDFCASCKRVVHKDTVNEKKMPKLIRVSKKLTTESPQEKRDFKTKDEKSEISSKLKMPGLNPLRQSKEILISEPTLFYCKKCEVDVIGNMGNHERSHCLFRGCPDTIDDDSERKKHMKMHDHSKPFWCKLCKKRYLHHTNLVKHFRSTFCKVLRRKSFK